MRFKQYLLEAKKEKEKKIVFVETDPQEYFPNDTISALQKEINAKAKDLTQEWSSAKELVDAAFNDLEVPIPLAYLKNRWEQYTKLLGVAINNLYDARGMKADWVKTV
jgi:hypothetical protein